ncbi:MAG: ATP-binding protein [Mariprofundaceae bacterium]|nr:ATP-binding protein [Mariprofundaceae bacterium]
MPRVSRRRLLHTLAWLLALGLSLGVFFVSLLLIEGLFYSLTGHPVSMAALVLAALITALLFFPLAHTMQQGLDRMFFRQYVDALEAIRHLGTGDLAELPVEGMEVALLERICMVSHRPAAALVEKAGEDMPLRVRSFPAESSRDLSPELEPPLRLPPGSGYELSLELPCRQGRAWLYLGMHDNGLPSDDDELEALRGLARFAVMSLEHARLTRQQAESARLDSLSRVAGQLHSHDLKNRLNDLSFLAHHIGSGKLEADDVARLMDAIRKVVGRMQTVMQRLADPQAPIHPRLAPVDLQQMLVRAVSDRLWPEGITIINELGDLPPVAGDEAMLSGVFENLFDNAVQAMQRKGHISLKASYDEKALTVQVQDDGCGMSASFLHERAFRLFSTSKESGLGIGLYLSRRIIEAQDGRLLAESPGEGKGCTFHLALPLWQARSASTIKERES